MNQFVYWYAPLWQVVMVVATGILLVFVLLWLRKVSWISRHTVGVAAGNHKVS